MNVKRILINLAATALLLIGLIAFAARFHFARQFGPTADRLQGQLHEARMEAIPLDAADLRPKRGIPESENAAAVYRRIDSTLRGLPDSVRAEEDRVINLARSREPAERAVAREIIRRRSPLLALAELAASRKFCWFDRPWKEGPNVQLPEYASMRQLARLFAARALIRSADGDLKGAFRSVEFGTKVGRHAGQDPIVIGLLVNLAIYAIMDSVFQDLALAGHADSSVVGAARSAAHFPTPPPLEHSFSGEVVTSRIAVDMARGGGWPGGSVANIIARRVTWLRKIMSDAWEVRIIQYWRMCFRSIRQLSDDPIAQAESVRSLGWELESKTSDPTYLLARVLMPVFSEVAFKRASIIEQERLRMTLLALIEHKRRSGDWPEFLNALPAEVEPDIFTEKPPIYRKTGDGFILYSVGDNLMDDGGIAKRDAKTGAFDLVIRYPRPAPAIP